MPTLRNVHSGVSQVGKTTVWQKATNPVIVSGPLTPADPRDHLSDPNAEQLIVGDADDLAPDLTTVSARSRTVYHSTLFEDFNLRANAVYNTFTVDEANNPVQDENVPARELPRYIELSWRPVPILREIAIGPATTRWVRPTVTKASDVLLSPLAAVESAANTFIQPGVLEALLVEPSKLPAAPKFSEDHFLTSDSAGGLAAGTEAAQLKSDYHLNDPRDSSVKARVTFIDPSIAGAGATGRLDLATDSIHLIHLGALSKLLPNLEVLSEFNQDLGPMSPPPAFPVTVDAPTLLYVGYVIERHKVGEDGSMTLDRIIEIDDTTEDYFVDRQVLFGTSYAYRIRTVVQWTHPSTITFGGISALNRFVPFDPAGGAPKKEASFYASDWSEWSRTSIIDNVLPDPPDEVFVRPVSNKGLIDIVWKMPNDPQLDIERVRLLRAVETGGALSGWQLLGDFPAANGRFVDKDVSPFEDSSQRYIYAMYTISKHGELSELGDQFEARLTRPGRIVNEYPINQVAPQGFDPLGHPADCRTPDRDWNVIARNRVGFYIRKGASVHPLQDRSYVVEVQSLSTGERAQVTLSVDAIDIIIRSAAVAGVT